MVVVMVEEEGKEEGQLIRNTKQEMSALQGQFLGDTKSFLPPSLTTRAC